MLTLWIIDDNRVLLESLSILLENDYKIRTFDEPTKCLSALRKGSPDVILTDYEMGRMNGLDLIRNIIHEWNCPKIIFYSGQLTPELNIQALAAGATACLSKPFDFKVLRRLLEA